MKTLRTTALQIIGIVINVEALFWITSDVIRFNERTLDYNLEFLYYTLPALIALSLTWIVVKCVNRIPSYIINFLIVLINTYSALCLIMITSGYCDLQKNLDIFYSSIVSIILIVIAYGLVKNVLLKISAKDILIATLATIISLTDFLIWLIGYKFFYPGNW